MIVRPALPLYVIAILAILLVAFYIFCIIKKKGRNLSVLRRCLIILFLLLAVLRPSLNGGDHERAGTNVALYFAIDNTSSMATEDVNGESRLSALKADALKIAKSFPGAYYAIYTQDEMTYGLVPVTFDSNTVATALNTMQTRPYYFSRPTDLNILLEQTSNKIDTYSERHPELQNVVIFMSDGENTSADDVQVEKGLFNKAHAGAVIGYGTEAGGKIPQYKWSNGALYKSTDYFERGGVCSDTLSGSLKCYHISKADQSYLEGVAREYGFAYTQSDGDLSSSWIDELKKKVTIETEDTSPESIFSNLEFYWIFALISLAMLLWEFSDSLDAILSEQEVKK